MNPEARERQGVAVLEENSLKSPARGALSEDSIFGRRLNLRAGHLIAVFSLLASFVLLAAVAGAGTASAACPNVVFRSGPSAKLPDCRAYELITPEYTGGLPPTFEGFIGDLPGMFSTDTVTPAGDSVVYHTV